MSATGCWQPLLEGEDAQRAREAIDAIASDLEQLELPDRSLYYGHAGVALLHGYLSGTGAAGAGERAARALERAAEAFSEERAPWLARGFGGVAFAIAHLTDVVDCDPETLEELDGAVAHLLDRDDWPFAWQLMIGLVGLGVYGLERAHTAGGRLIIERVEGHLARLAERTAGGATWRAHEADLSPELEAQNPDGFYNLGAPYGVAGAIAFLAAAHRAGALGDPSLLSDAVAWLRGQEEPAAEVRFPGYLAAGYREPSPLGGWCGGNEIAGLVLVDAGIAARESSWIEHGLAVARHAARQACRSDAAGQDLSLCHGWIGRAHIFNRVAHATGSNELSEAARWCYRRTLGARVPGSGIGGFSDISRSAKTRDPAYAPGLQLGATGLALGLTAAISEAAPDWDRALLVAVPPRG